MQGTEPSVDQAVGPVAGAGVYRFILPTFEGPLDLLLHLIRVNEVDIKDIPVVEIARQYDEIVDLMQEMNLDVAGEFLVMAATLVYIKSKMLLPVDRERIEEGLEEDPRAELARSLLEHQRFRRVAEQLEEQERLAALVFTRTQNGDCEEGYLDVSLGNLVDALRRVMEMAGRRALLRFKRLHLPLAEMIKRILQRLQHQDFISFGSLIDQAELLRPEVRIVAFLAVLELVRRRRIRAYQVRPFDEIRLRAGAPS